MYPGGLDDFAPANVEAAAQQSQRRAVQRTKWSRGATEQALAISYSMVDWRTAGGFFSSKSM